MTNETFTPGSPFSGSPIFTGSKGDPHEKPIGKLGNWLIYQRKHGGMGEVLICGLSGDDARAALKSFQVRLFFDPTSRQAFVSELMIWLRLSGTPFIVPALAVQRYDDRLFVVMPAVLPDDRGVATVSDLLALETIPPVEVFAIAWQLAAALKFSTDTIPGVSHGDLKPSNLLWEGHLLQVADFGLARIGTNGAGGMRGTPGYESPEYAERGSTPEGDIYAYGAILKALIGRYSTVQPEYLAKITSLADRCLNQDPQARPSAQQVVLALGELVREHAEELREPFMRAAHFHSMFRMIGAGTATAVAEGLLQIEQPAAALEVLERVPEDHSDARTYLLRGSSLSLLDRDSEALDRFETALKRPISEIDRIRALSEVGLSLRRLGRHAEAERLYLKLLPEVSGTDHTRIVVNLAGVYLAAEKAELAANLLRRFLVEHNDEPLAHALMGQAQEELAEHEQALIHYRRAVALRPSMANMQVCIARVLITHFRDPNGASAALFAAHQQGFASEEWYVLALATETLLGNRGDAETLLQTMRSISSPEYAQALERKAMDLAVDVLRREAGIQPKQVGEIKPPESTVEPHSAKETVEPVSVTPALVSSHASAQEPAGIPFFNVRFYQPENRYSVDYYGNLGAENFAQEFEHSWNLFRRDPNVGNAEPRSTPFYFCQCPGCGVDILTNRDVGKDLLCRQCHERHPTQVRKTHKTSELLQAVESRLGRSFVTHAGSHLYLMFQPTGADNSTFEKMLEVCRNEGFLTADLPARTRNFINALASNDPRIRLDHSRDIAVVQKVSDSRHPVYQGETPEETDRLIRHLRNVGSIWSMSFSIDPSRDDFFTLLMTERFEELEQLYRKAADGAAPDAAENQMLVTVLILTKKYDEAKATALALTTANPLSAENWTLLADAEYQLGLNTAAIEHLQHALVLDPRDRRALVSLLDCYRRLGDQPKLEEVRERIEALGGMWLT